MRSENIDCVRSAGQRSPRGELRRAARGRDQRRHRLERILERVRVVGDRGDLGGAVGLPEEDVLRLARDRAERRRRHAPRVRHHVARHAADRAREAEVLGRFVREDRDDLRVAAADVLDRVERARRREIHVAFAHAEDVVPIAAREDGDERLALRHVSEFVGVGMPMRLAKAALGDREPVERHAFEDGKGPPGHRRAGARGRAILRLQRGERVVEHVERIKDEGSSIRGVRIQESGVSGKGALAPRLGCIHPQS
jgi:hypothetical protein